MYKKQFTSYVIIVMVFNSCLAKEIEEYSSCKQTLYNVDLPSVEQFRELVQKFFDKITKVIENIDPFSMDHVGLDYNSYGITSDGYLNKLLISGPSTVKFNRIDVDDDNSLQFSVDLNVKNLQCLSSYKLNFDTLTLWSIYGSGDFGIALSGIHLSMGMTVKQLLDKRLQLTELNIDFSIEGGKVDIDSILNSTYTGAYLSNVLSDLLPLIFNELPPLKTYGSIGAMAAINSAMCDKGITLDFVIEFMQKFIQ